MSGAKLGHGAATGEPRAGRCQVERAGTAGQVRLSPPRDTRPVLASKTVDKVTDEWDGQKCTKMGSNERNVKQMLPTWRGSWREVGTDEKGTCLKITELRQVPAAM